MTEKFFSDSLLWWDEVNVFLLFDGFFLFSSDANFSGRSKKLVSNRKKSDERFSDQKTIFVAMLIDSKPVNELRRFQKYFSLLFNDRRTISYFVFLLRYVCKGAEAFVFWLNTDFLSGIFHSHSSSKKSSIRIRGTSNWRFYFPRALNKSWREED